MLRYLWKICLSERHTPVPDLIVLENFRLWKHRALQQAGSSLPAAQAIGMVKAYAKIRGIDLVEQSPQILEKCSENERIFNERSGTQQDPLFKRG
jgi:hypothetical protein